jgi:outer membrane protein TolC
LRRNRKNSSTLILSLACVLVLCGGARAYGEVSSPQEDAAQKTPPLVLEDLVREALARNPDLLAFEAKLKASGHRIPQVKSLPDPKFMFGYQNVGWNRYTLGEFDGSQWIFTGTQSVPYPGKLRLKGEMAGYDSQALEAGYRALQLSVVQKVKELYFDLFLYYRERDILASRKSLYDKIEQAALARYSSGTGLEQEVLMAQAEKYMLMEKDEMLRQKIEAGKGILNALLAREVNAPLGRPEEPVPTKFDAGSSALLNAAGSGSPQIKAGEKAVDSAGKKLELARKEYYPDFTFTGGVFKRSGEFQDMWSLTAAINIPVFYKTKQREGVREAEELLSASERELESSRYMVASGIRENYSILESAERQMRLYREGLVPVTERDVDAALANYRAGKTDQLTVINDLRALLDYENSYWEQFCEREKAIARLDALAGRGYE